MNNSLQIKALGVVLVATFFGCVFTYFDGAMLAFLPDTRLVLNVTPSIPTGIYRLDADNISSFRVGDIVYFPVPPGHESILYGRGYLPPNAQLIKPVAAIAGDHVCVDDGHLLIRQIGPNKIFEMDSLGRPLPQLSFCRELEKGEIFILSSYSEQSYDSRYFGPVLEENVIAKAQLLVTFGTFSKAFFRLLLAF